MLKKLSNDQLSSLVITGVVLLMIVSVIEALSSIVTIVLLVGIVPIALIHRVAKFIDYMDDSVEYKVEMSRLYHLVYAVGISLALAIVLANVTVSAVTLPLWLVETIAPQLVFMPACFLFGMLGYWIAWQSIPNKESK